MVDGKLEIHPNEWLIPVAKSAKTIRSSLEVVRIEPQQTQKASEEAISLLWCGRREYCVTSSHKRKLRGSFLLSLLVFELSSTRFARSDASSTHSVSNQRKNCILQYSFFFGAGGENRTLIVCLEGRHISHYTTPA